MRFIATTLIVAGALITGCNPAPVAQSKTDTTSGPIVQPKTDTTPAQIIPDSQNLTSEQMDWQAILQLEQQAKALVDSAGCATASACKAAPVGSRACGGPRYYIVYCSTTTDSVKLHEKLAEVAAAENAYNRKYNVASTCEMRMPPPLDNVKGVCRATIPMTETH